MPACAVEEEHGMCTGATVRAISAKCAFIVAVLTKGRTSPAAVPRRADRAK